MQQYCKAASTPAIAANFIPLAEQALKEQHSYVRYLEELLEMECEERDRMRSRIKFARRSCRA